MDAVHDHSYLELFSWSVDIEWSSGILLSIYNRNSDGFLSSINNNDLDWTALTESLGLVYHISSPCNSSILPFTFNTFKLSGVLILLGVSTYWCYKCLKSFNIRIRSCSQRAKCNVLSPDDIETSSPPSPTNDFNNLHTSNWSLLDGVDNYLDLQTKYFGPSDPSQGNDEPTPKVPNHDTYTRGGEKYRQKLKQYSACLDGEDTSTSNSSTSSSPFSNPNFPNNNSLTRDLSYDSLGFSNGKYGDDSIDSTSSEISLDLVSNFEQSSENSTVARLDKLQEEIDELKNNCLLMDEEFGIIKCNRNLPGLSNLMETNPLQGSKITSEEEILKKQNARACFKGLYSLTTINRSMSLEFADSIPVHRMSIDETSQVSCVGDSAEMPSMIEEDHLPSLEWDEEEMNNFPDGVEQSISNKESNILFTPDRSESCESALDMTRTWSMCSSMSISDIETHLSNNDGLSDSEVENVGPRQNLLIYAQNKWNNNTTKAQTIIQGCKEIISSLDCKYLRRVKADNNSIIRSTIFQILTHGIPIPSSEQTLQNLYKAMDSGQQFLLNWKFSNSLPFSKNNIRQGMEICLHTLDNVASMMDSNYKSLLDHEDSLCRLLNADPTLDVYILEAVKLRMMSEALNVEIRDNKIQNMDKALFYKLMTVRESSEAKTDIINLRQTSDTLCFEQVELFLLGYALGITLKVIRPSAFNTDGFICFYPNVNVGVWPQVLLIAIDDKYYNVLV